MTLGKKSREKREARGEKRYARSTWDLLARLRYRIRRLRADLAAFDAAPDEQLAGDISTHLRALVIERGRQRPLLIDLMDGFNSKTVVKSETPPDQGRLRPLREYLDELQLKQPKLEGDGSVMLTNRQLILVCADQFGAHDDWSHDEQLAALRAGGVYFGSVPAYVMCLRAVARTVASVGEAFIEELRARGVTLPP